MKANELRIGNLIYSDRQELYKIIAIDEDAACIKGVERGAMNGTYLYDDNCFDPIPLTEEWLLKFGAIKCEDVFELGHTEWIKKENYFVPNPYYFADGFIDNFKLKYVHQLQNLYFALTGEELQIKESV